MKVTLYRTDRKNEWDDFVFKAKNKHFIFFRDYMDYHHDRFTDYSLMVYSGNQLIAVLPANISEQVVYSHQGLTFAGLIISENTRAIDVLMIFESMINFLKSHQVIKLVYKCIPYIYSNIPADEDRYALFINNATLIRCDISAAIYMDHKIKYSKLRNRAIKKAHKNNIRVIEQKDYSEFWRILSSVLEENHKTKPVHSLGEMMSLATRFPENIRLFVAINTEKEVLAGTIMYITKQVAHTQYIASNAAGRQTGALDLIVDYLINHIFKSKKTFDFGTSNEHNGTFLNQGLIAHKEGFGARGVVHDFYEIQIS